MLEKYKPKSTAASGTNWSYQSQNHCQNDAEGTGVNRKKDTPSPSSRNAVSLWGPLLAAGKKRTVISQSLSSGITKLSIEGGLKLRDNNQNSPAAAKKDVFSSATSDVDTENDGLRRSFQRRDPGAAWLPRIYNIDWAGNPHYSCPRGFNNSVAQLPWLLGVRILYCSFFLNCRFLFSSLSLYIGSVEWQAGSVFHIWTW